MVVWRNNHVAFQKETTTAPSAATSTGSAFLPASSKLLTVQPIVHPVIFFFFNREILFALFPWNNVTF